MSTTDSFFFNEMKRYSEVTMWGEPFTILDFYTSTTPDLVLGDVEKDTYRVKTLKDPKIILDLGANIGMWAMAVAKRFPNAQVMAVEAAPWNFANLCLNIERNKITNIIPIRAILGGSGKKEVSLYQHPLNSGGCSIRNPSNYPAVRGQESSLDSIVGDLIIDFMKVDIEGSEYDTFKDFTKWDQVKRLGIELHGYQDKRESTEAEKEALYSLIASKIGKENVAAISHNRSYLYGEVVSWGSVQAEEEDMSRQGLTTNGV